MSTLGVGLAKNILAGGLRIARGAPVGLGSGMPFGVAASITSKFAIREFSAVAGGVLGRGFASAAGSGAKGAVTAAPEKPARTWQAPIDHKQDNRGIQGDLVKKFLGETCMPGAEKNQISLKKTRESFARHELDCGSSEVQVAILSTKIQYMITHLQLHKKDHVSRRGLQAMLETRRKLLRYLRRTDGDRYVDTISRLRLKDNVVPKGKNV